jgi:hypothetical protein
VPIEDQEIVIAREHARRDRAAHPAEADEAAIPSRHPPASACRLRPLREQLRPHLRNGKAGLRRIGRLLGRELIMKRERVKALDEGREHGVELVLRCLGVEVHLCEAVDPNLGR